MRYQGETSWHVVKCPEVPIPRTGNPVYFTLEEAVSWIRNNKPILWVGSIFSVPQPSGLPSGAALTKAIFDIIFPTDTLIDQGSGEPLDTDRRQAILSRFSLEELFDEFELHGMDQSLPLLELFSRLNQDAKPNGLHEAVVRYYSNGLAQLPLCITTNWDTLLERAFRDSGNTVHSYGPADGRTPSSASSGIVDIYHAHGCFEQKNVVCSAFVEQGLLEFPWLDSTPMVFLGYSGYEPSLYPHLEKVSHQLWCVRDKTDMAIPAKRRLLSRPNTYVFVGDLRELLRAVGVLQSDVDLVNSNTVALKGSLPDKLLSTVRKQLLSTLNPRIAAGYSIEVQLTAGHDPNFGVKAWRLHQAIDKHLRDRNSDFSLPLALLAARSHPFPQQPWTSLIASLLRSGLDPQDPEIRLLLSRADAEPKTEGFPGGSLYARYRAFRDFVGVTKPSTPFMSDAQYATLVGATLHDTAMGGELCELAGFSCLWNGEDERARGFFDTAATNYYLSGVWRGGAAMEWASNHLAELREKGKRGTLFIPSLE